LVVIEVSDIGRVYLFGGNGRELTLELEKARKRPLLVRKSKTKVLSWTIGGKNGGKYKEAEGKKVGI
jgi:hypothetical protein